MELMLILIDVVAALFNTSFIGGFISGVIVFVALTYIIFNLVKGGQ